MPELPEVERGRKLAEQVGVGRRIERVHCARDPLVFDGVSPQRIKRALEGREVRAARRRGKHLYFELDRRPWPLFHYGMTGSFRIPGDVPIRLSSSGRQLDSSWPPRFTKIRMVFDDRGELAMTNARRLGRIRLREDPLTEPPLSRLGFDPLIDLPSARELQSRIGRRSISLKGLLLDQSFAAGVGNWIADEVLYQARLDPRRSASSLTFDEVKNLRAKLKHVTVTAVSANADKGLFPRTWLFHHRWGRRDDARTQRGERIEHLTLAGRTTAWVPTTQR